MAHQDEILKIKEKKNDNIIDMIFDKLDYDKTGQITPKKIVRGGKGVGIKMDSEKAEKMIAEIDKEGKGSINFKQFKNCMEKVLNKIHKDTEMYKKSFKKFDVDGNGSIDKEELMSVLCSGDSRRMSEAEVESLFNEADVDGDGQLSYNEFVEYFCKI